MGTFEGHLLPGLGFVGIGVWHLLNILRNYVANPTGYRTQSWFPAKLPGRWKYMELYAIILGACCSISAELVICQPTHQPFGPNWEIPIYNMAQFEHSAMSFFFLIYGVTSLCSELLEPLPFGILHLIAAGAFTQELMLFHFHSGDHMAVEGHYHLLLQFPVTVIILCTLLEILLPTSFLPPLVRAMALTLQGLWFVQTAFSIWVPAFVSMHCRRVDNWLVQCDDDGWNHRAKALANLQFNWYLAGVIIGTLVLFALVRRAYRLRGDPYEAVECEEDGKAARRHLEYEPPHVHSPPLGGSSPSRDEDPKSIFRNQSNVLESFQIFTSGR